MDRRRSFHCWLSGSERRTVGGVCQPPSAVWDRALTNRTSTRVFTRELECCLTGASNFHARQGPALRERKAEDGPQSPPLGRIEPRVPLPFGVVHMKLGVKERGIRR